MEEKFTQKYNTWLSRDSSLGPCGWKAEILPLRQPHHQVSTVFVVARLPVTMEILNEQGNFLVFVALWGNLIFSILVSSLKLNLIL